MTDCVKCGHELGIGRYCTNCGHPVDGPAASAPDPEWRTGTAERPVVPPPAAPPPAPPPAWTPPPAARFPLFADEVDDADAPAEPVAPRTHRRTSRPWGAWVAVAVALVVVAFLGIRLLGGDDNESPAAQDPSSSAPATDDEPEEQDEEPSEEEPSAEGSDALTAEAEVSVPKTAGPGQDADGNPVDYEAVNMLDGVPETCWRMAGDGTGSEITLTLPEETQLRSVGLINGYAKQAADRDWYHGNRRILQVEWEFDDGSTVPQTLEDTRSVQSVDVDVATTTITLRLVEVSKPGTGAARRNFTAISDLLLVAG